MLHVNDHPSTDGLAEQLWAILTEELTRQLKVPFETIRQRMDAPGRQVLEQQLIQLADAQQCCLLFTTGGIGARPTDVVPEATGAVCPKRFPGFGELIRQISLSPTDPSALLLRPVVGLRSQTVVVNLPDDPQRLLRCLPALFPAIPNAYFLASGQSLTKR